MNIDKASFLLLAGALAAGACTITSSTGGTDDDDGTGATGAGATGAGTTTDGGSGGGDGGMGGAGGGTCDDSMGTAADCSLAMTSCTEGVAVIDDITLCNVAADFFKPGVAEEATNCIVNLDTANTCEDALLCRDAALNNACDDDVVVECGALVAECAGAIDQGNCETILPGFNDTGRTAIFDQCGATAPGGCLQGTYADLLECVDNLVPTQ